MEQRELKFRYWDNKIKSFVYSDDYKFGCKIARLREFFTQAVLYAQVIQQYTNFKDDNGREIYEGDILKVKDYPFSSRAYKPYVSLVTWPYYGDSLVEFRKIIGNTIQNPELLKEENK